MGMTTTLELRRSAEGRWRTTSRAAPDRHQFSSTLFGRFLADGIVHGNVVAFDVDDSEVCYRILPPGEDQPPTVVDVVLIDSPADTDDAVGGTAAFDAWREHGARYTPKEG
jgi:hypothetical protein